MRLTARVKLATVIGLCLLGPVGCCKNPPKATTRPAADVAVSVATQPAPSYTYVLVHGAWAGGWEWKRVGTLLKAHGHDVYRPTLTGQGERVHLAEKAQPDLETHITDVVNTILFEDLQDVVLMGHSYGGMVITGVADRVPERIKAIVYVDAALPVDGETANDAFGRRMPTSQPFLIPNGWPYPPERKPPYIVPHPTATLNQPIRLTNAAAREIPAVYILTVDPGKRPQEDVFFKFHERAKERGWTTWIMDADHVPNINKPKELAELLEKAPEAAHATESTRVTETTRPATQNAR